MNRLATALALGFLALLPATATADAFDWQLHGFAAQAYSLSHGNEYFGDSRHGSSDFYELGLNGTVLLRTDLLFAAQGVLRRAGAADTEGLRLDYAQADYAFVSSAKLRAGLRLGRVKHPYGFYNDARDVVFTRPGISLPGSVYLESAGLRSVLFSGDGAQVYGDATLGEHLISVEANYDLPHDANDKQKLQIVGGLPLANDLRFSSFYAARVHDEWNGGQLRFAASYLHALLSLEPDPKLPFEGSESFGLWVFSTQYNLRQWSLTGEYFLSFVKGGTNIGGPVDYSGDGFYLQADWHILPAWTASLRYNASFADRHDRDGRAYVAQNGGDRYSRFSHDEMLGLRWLPGAHWGFWIEGHLIQGSSDAPTLDNLGRRLADHSSLLQVMAAYHF